jgi:hypothetical protein
MSSTSSSERRPSVFLSLAPATSDSYPQTPKPRQSSTESTTTTPLTADLLVNVDPTVAAKRRASSISSDGSKSGLRYLKLGPVHDGEHLDGQKGDWHEVAVE